MADDTPDPQRFRTLPAPIPREHLRTSQASHPGPEEKDDRFREMEWLLRVSAG